MNLSYEAPTPREYFASLVQSDDGFAGMDQRHRVMRRVQKIEAILSREERQRGLLPRDARSEE